MAESNLDDSSHYELSLTAGQAFVAFVLLLLSLAASFAFGIMIGKGQIEGQLVAQRDPQVVNESARVASVQKSDSKIVELGVPEGSEFGVTQTLADAGTEPAPRIVEEPLPAEDSSSVAPPDPAPAAETPRSTAKPAGEPAVPFYAQLLSTSDATAAEGLAAKLIDNGFPTAYVERQTGGASPVYRVRVRFPSEAAARAAVDRLKEFSRGDVWVTRQ